MLTDFIPTDLAIRPGDSTIQTGPTSNGTEAQLDGLSILLVNGVNSSTASSLFELG